MEKILSKSFGDPEARQIQKYEAGGGYRTLRKAIGMAPEKITEEVLASNLRGRGGAGFPAGRKWSFLPKDAEEIYLVVNADEGEPGTFKDRTLMRWDPHRLVEGCIVTCLAINAHQCYIYIRGELVEEASILNTAIEEARKKGYLGKSVLGKPFPLEITVHRGAGAYICGEETALINSLEGRRGMPRLKPPFPAVAGAFMKPTIVNNVETVSYVPPILEMGGAKFAELGDDGEGGLRLVAISGHVERPGVYELPCGTNLLEIINEHAGGVRGGKALKAVIPGGSSTPVLTAEECDVPYSIAAMGSAESIGEVEVLPDRKFDMGGGKTLRSSPGSGAIVVMDETVDMVHVAARLMHFYAHESCGQCTPCRVGCNWLMRLSHQVDAGEGSAADLEQLALVAEGIAGNTICPLGDAAAWPILGLLTKFRDEFMAKVSG
jgi:NADH-quinone oxidoreductase subunit F